MLPGSLFIAPLVFGPTCPENLSDVPDGLRLVYEDRPVGWYVRETGE